ncbi:LANO_0C01156g1_1 [Lachancea nothofagi CBS 11611]|uniref:LANO_0C01156g1_1 n=1 Tax=Lachancea nothofagi CBS 11611 TaxID=1266666 RepID=A0A1G4J3Q1_9SACH|nr:LANO_0C01156g1_1 [Lachancea nothofagi CBS 11611]
MAIQSQSTVSLPTLVTQSTQSLLNRRVSTEDSLYHICLTVRKRLELLPQIKPYLNLAHSSSELSSERQALLLSQKQQLNQQHHRSVGSQTSSVSNGNGTKQGSDRRISALSTNSYSDEQDTSNLSIEETVVTFSMGILPISMDCDPVTQLSHLFQQGSPLCIIFNAVKPQFKLPVVSSDDLKICKKSIYDFILACKKYFTFSDEELFTISDVFSNATDHFIKVLDVVITLLDSAPQVFPQVPVEEVKWSNTDQGKIVREFVETERKYVYDLEILNEYRNQLLQRGIISSEELYMLFPNLNDIIDFQRRFLISLEINGQVEPFKQRIGALFMHSKHFFKLYEPWSIGQTAAIDFISSSFDKMQRSDFVIANKLELQSFLLKPVQRLCKYPLLLRELLQQSNNTANCKELELAWDISKSIARNINENQRRTENHEVVKKLYDRVVNWKGYRIAKFGELLYFDKVSISTGNPNETEHDFEVYLFEKIIILFSEVVQKKGNSISLKKKSSSASASTLHLSVNGIGSSSPSGSSGEPKLDLRGRIMIVNLNKITPIDSRCLNIIWESPKEQGNFVLKFKNEETRDSWSSSLQVLLRQVRSESLKSNNSNSDRSSLSSNNYFPHNSMNSLNSNQNRRISDVLPRFHTHQSFENEYRSISENYRASIPETTLLVRISFQNDFYTVLVEINSGIENLLQIIKRKLTHAGTITKIKYQDEDGDYVMLESEDDWSVVKDMLRESSDRILNVWAYS